MIIDLHAHYGEETGYLDRLLAEMDRLGIDKVCLSAFGPHLGKQRGNRDVVEAFRAHPDRVIGFAFIRPGWDGPDEVDKWHDEGMTGIKVTCPRNNYDDQSYYPIWARAEELGMPALFHTGVVTMAGTGPEDDISSARMHPMMLEPITRAFPALTIICAHLGIHWNSDAAELLRMRPTVWADITGEPGGYREWLLPRRIREYLWWPGAFDRLVFGTDVDPSNIETNLARDRALFESLRLPPETRDRYFHKNAEEILGL